MWYDVIYSLQQRLDLNTIPLLTRSNNITITVTRKARKAISLGWGITTSFRILPRQIVVFWRELSSYAKVHAAFGVSLRELPRLSQSVATLSSFTALTGNQIQKKAMCNHHEIPRKTAFTPKGVLQLPASWRLGMSRVSIQFFNRTCPCSRYSPRKPPLSIESPQRVFEDLWRCLNVAKHSKMCSSHLQSVRRLLLNVAAGPAPSSLPIQPFSCTLKNLENLQAIEPTTKHRWPAQQICAHGSWADLLDANLIQKAATELQETPHCRQIWPLYQVS